MQNLLTIAQVAEKLGFAPKTVRAWINGGQLAGYKMPGKKGEWRLSEEHIENWLKKRTVK